MILLEHIPTEIGTEIFNSRFFLDYSKAFNCLGYRLIVEKLNPPGVEGAAKEWLVSYLADQLQAVELQDTINFCTNTRKSNSLPMK